MPIWNWTTLLLYGYFCNVVPQVPMQLMYIFYEQSMITDEPSKYLKCWHKVWSRVEAIKQIFLSILCHGFSIHLNCQPAVRGLSRHFYWSLKSRWTVLSELNSWPSIVVQNICSFSYSLHPLAWASTSLVYKTVTRPTLSPKSRGPSTCMLPVFRLQINAIYLFTPVIYNSLEVAPSVYF